MQKITKPEVRCKTCNAIIHWAKSEEFCDECGKKLIDDKKNGYPMNIRFILYENGNFNANNDDDFNFCSIKHGFKWLRKNAKKILKEEDDFCTLDYWHKSNIDELFKLLVIK
jgi:hypothetical protein